LLGFSKKRDAPPKNLLRPRSFPTSFSNAEVSMGAKTIAFVGAAVFSVAWLAQLGAASGAKYKTYTATSTLNVSRQKPTLLSRDERATSSEEFEAVKKTQKARVKSRPVLRAALAKPDVAKLPSVREAADAIGWLGRIVKVEFPDDAEIMTISCTAEDPKEAKLLARAVVDAYIAEVENLDRAVRRYRCSELEKYIVERETEFRRKLETLNQLSAGFASDDAKAAKKPVPVDIQILHLEVGIAQDFIREMRMELERARAELQAMPRITLWEPAEEPTAADQ
jgi:hypothetical protein